MERFTQGRREFLKIVGISGGAVLLDGLSLMPAFAKDVYPAERINWICYVKAGGPFDLIARNVAPYLRQYLKESSVGVKGGDVIIKNVPEAGGNRAFGMIYNAKPDGYTIGDFNTSYATENINTSSDIDCNKYTYLVRTGVLARLVAVHKNSPFITWEEMMKAGKKKELKIAVGNFGRGAHITSILLKEIAKLPARLINFPGAVENTNALLRGDVHMAMLNETSVKAMVDAGEFKVLTILSDVSPYPGVPSIAQLGFPELADPLKVHYLVVGPPNMPKEISDVLISGFKKVFADKQFAENMKKMDFDPDPLFGVDAERLAKRIFKYYDDNMPILKKYLS